MMEGGKMAVNSRTAVSGRRTRTWLIGVYIRLSKEDARHLDESESVTNQRSIIEDYIASMDDGDEYRIVDEYVDDGISGTTDDEREDFQRMLKDIRRGRVNCVIVKTLRALSETTVIKAITLTTGSRVITFASYLFIISHWTVIKSRSSCEASLYRFKAF